MPAPNRCLNRSESGCKMWLLLSLWMVAACVVAEPNSDATGQSAPNLFLVLVDDLARPQSAVRGLSVECQRATHHRKRTQHHFTGPCADASCGVCGVLLRRATTTSGGSGVANEIPTV